MTGRHVLLLAALAVTGSLAVAGFVLGPYVHDFFMAGSEGGCDGGELKEGPSPPPPRQGKSIPAGGARAVGAGGNRSCAVLNDHGVRCWGDDQQHPAGVFVAPLRGEPIQLSLSGTGYGCYRAGGSVQCWEPDGEHGVKVSAGPRDIDFVTLWTGLDSACARRQNGEVWCWGRGEPWLDPHEWLPPSHLPGLDGADDVSITPHHVCVRRGARISCTARPKLESLRAPPAPEATPARIQSGALAGCGHSSCAIGDDGRVVCWSGADGDVIAQEPSRGVRALERAGDAVCATDAADRTTCWRCDDLRGGKPLALIAPTAAPRSFSGGEECLVEATGTVRCRGSIPPAGNGLTLRDAPPHRLAGITDAVDVELDRRLLCTRGRERPWSCVPRLSEGRRSGPDDWLRSSTPEAIAAPPGTARVFLHRFAICFVTLNGRASCHRREPDGALGAPLEIVNVERMAVGNHHACAVNTAGELWCWGANESGQALGLPSPASLSRPQKAIGDVMDVAVGLRHTCILMRDRRISCLGDNSDARLGAIGEKDASGLMGVPGFGETAKQLVAGYEQTCVLGETGKVWCWGGAGARASERVGPQPVSGLTSAALQLSSGGHQMCALLADRTVSCWSDSQARPERVPGSEGSAELALGDNHGCVRTQSGAVRCWGLNALNQLGRDLPVRRIEVRPPRGCLQIEYSAEGTTATAADVVW